MWLKTTAFMGAALMVPYTLFVIYKEATHAHSHDEHVAYPHMKVRRKAFPWVSWWQLPSPSPPLAARAGRSHTPAPYLRAPSRTAGRQPVRLFRCQVPP